MDMNSKSALSSEVFREFVKISLEQHNLKSPQAELHGELAAMEELQAHINSNPKLKLAFKRMQERLLIDEEYRYTIDKSFADGVLSLNLENE